jgi:hypothetical protein
LYFFDSDDIDSHIDNAAASTIQAKGQLSKAAKTQKSNSSLVLSATLWYQCLQNLAVLNQQPFNFLLTDMLVAGHLWGCPAHSDNSPCSLSLEDHLRLQNLTKLKEFLDKLFLLCSQECILVSDWRLPFLLWHGGIFGGDVPGMHGLHVYRFPVPVVLLSRMPALFISVMYEECVVVKQRDLDLCYEVPRFREKRLISINLDFFSFLITGCG